MSYTSLGSLRPVLGVFKQMKCSCMQTCVSAVNLRARMNIGLDRECNLHAFVIPHFV